MRHQDHIDFFGAAALFLAVALVGAFCGTRSAIEDVQAQTQRAGEYEDHWYEFRSPRASGE